MKAYIWNKPYHVYYGSSFLFVLADTLDEARERLPKILVSNWGHINDESSTLHDEAIQHCIKNEPDRVVEYGECYTWSE